MLTEFIGNLVPILNGERTFPRHHNGHFNIVIPAINMSVMEAVAQIKITATLALFWVRAWILFRRFHIKNHGLTFVFFNQLSQDLLPQPFASQLFTDSKVPEPIDLWSSSVTTRQCLNLLGIALAVPSVERWSGIYDGEANKCVTIAVSREIKMHLLH